MDEKLEILRDEGRGGTRWGPDGGDGTVKTHTRSSCVHLTAGAFRCPVLRGPQSA